MRIGWVTPFNERSAIARYARDVVAELLRRGIEVRILRSEIGAALRLPVLETEAPVHLLGHLGVEQLKSNVDLFVVTLADHFEFNSGSFEILRAVPSVGIFHDADVRNLALGVVDHSGIGLEPLDRIRAIGSMMAMPDPPFGKDLAWLATLCVGAVSHSPHYESPLKAYCPGPTLLLPLCHHDPGPPRPDRRADMFTVLTFGNLNANKQADRVLRALARSQSLKQRAVYRLVGAVAPRERARLLELAEELEISPPVFEGWVPDARLQQILGEAHVICCLRYPILEGGSGSLIFSLYSGNPVIVANAGAYAQVPDDLVWKVSYGTESDDVRRALEFVADHQDEADRRGAQAREWACRTFSVSAYVDTLLPFFDECLAVAPLINASRVLGGTLSDLRPAVDEPALERIGSVLQGLFTAPGANGD